MLPTDKLKTLSQLQAQIVPTKRDALIALNGSDTVVDTSSAFRKDGQVESQTAVSRDVETSALISTKTITWTYYEKEKGYPVDVITIVETDSKGTEIKRLDVKHYPDGKQPELMEVKLEAK
jgi:hypothetical protein